MVPQYGTGTFSTGFFFNYGFCAKSCPSTANATVDCAAPIYNGTCTDLFVTYGSYATNNVLNYCIPDGDNIANSSTTESYGGWILSLYETRWVILTCIGISLVIAFMYLKFLDCFAVPLAYITILVI